MRKEEGERRGLEEEEWRLEDDGGEIETRKREGGWRGGTGGGRPPAPVSLPRRWCRQHGRGVRTGRPNIAVIQTMINLEIKMRKLLRATRMAWTDEDKDFRENN